MDTVIMTTQEITVLNMTDGFDNDQFCKKNNSCVPFYETQI
mgnify:CR=1 FL=1